MRRRAGPNHLSCTKVTHLVNHNSRKHNNILRNELTVRKARWRRNGKRPRLGPRPSDFQFADSLSWIVGAETPVFQADHPRARRAGPARGRAGRADPGPDAAQSDAAAAVRIRRAGRRRSAAAEQAGPEARGSRGAPERRPRGGPPGACHRPPGSGQRRPAARRGVGHGAGVPDVAVRGAEARGGRDRRAACRGRPAGRAARPGTTAAAFRPGAPAARSRAASSHSESGVSSRPARVAGWRANR